MADARHFAQEQARTADRKDCVADKVIGAVPLAKAEFGKD
jgi:hypothetical protein